MHKWVGRGEQSGVRLAEADARCEQQGKGAGRRAGEGGRRRVQRVEGLW